MSDLHLKTASQIAELVKNKEITAVEVAEYFLKRAEELNPKVKALNSITSELAMSQAKQVDHRIANGEDLILAGVPIVIKDNLCVKGTKTTCSSNMLKNFTAPYESTVTDKLWEAGAICIGKANLDEFAMGSSTEYSAFGASHNPYNLDCVPGGSSGGSAVAVSARMAPVSLGSDTGGSIRQPASFCGVVGMKPTYGAVSRYGLIAFASSLDQVGPFATNIDDANLIASVISGNDKLDSTSLINEININSQAENINIKDLKIGYMPEVLENNSIQQEVKDNYQELINNLKEQGAEFVTVDMPLSMKNALDCYYVIAPAEASSNLSRFDGVRFGFRDKEADNLVDMYCDTREKGFGTEVKRRILIGTYALSAGYYDAYYNKALKVRNLISQEYKEVFSNIDVLITPTAPSTAFKFNSKLEDPLSMYLCDVFTIPINLTGVPALSLNSGYDNEGLPIGTQLIVSQGQDQKLFNIAKSIESLISQKQEVILPINI